MVRPSLPAGLLASAKGIAIGASAALAGLSVVLGASNPLGAAAAAAVGGLAGPLAGWFGKRIEKLDHVPKADELFRNHDLTQAIGLALRAVLESLRSDELIDGSAEDASHKLEKELPDAFSTFVEQQLSAGVTPELLEAHVPRMLTRFTEIEQAPTASTTQPQNVVRDEAGWSDFFGELWSSALGRKGAGVSTLSKVFAKNADARFAGALREVLKWDAGDGGGRAFAGALLMYLAQLDTEVLALGKAQEEGFKGLSIEHEDHRRRLNQLFTQLESRSEQIFSAMNDAFSAMSYEARNRHIELLQRVQRTEARIDGLTRSITAISERTDRIHRVLTDFVLPRSKFEERYWKHRRPDEVSIKKLLADPTRARLVRDTVLGRTEWRERVHAFLNDPDLVGMYMHAPVGVGKSRLCLRVADWAQAMGWEVAFLRESGLSSSRDPASVLDPWRRVSACGQLLLVWDNLNTEYEFAQKLASYVSDVTTDSVSDLPRIKLLVNSWPIQARATRNGLNNVKEWSFHELSNVGSKTRNALEQFVGNLVPSLTTHQVVVLVDKTKGNILASIHAANLVVGSGISALDGLSGPHSIFAASYRKMLAPLFVKEDQSAEHTRFVLRSLAVLGSVEVASLPDSLADHVALLGRLSDRDIISCERDEHGNDKSYALAPDSFRHYIIAASLGMAGGEDKGVVHHGLRMAPTPAKRWAELVIGFGPSAFREAWQHTLEATATEDEDDELLAISKLADAARLGAARDSAWLLALTACAYPSEHVETADEVSSVELRSIRIAAISGHAAFEQSRDNENAKVEARAVANGLMNASVSYETGAECLEMAGRIAAIRGEHDFGKDPELALVHAKALMNASVSYETGAERLEMAGRIAAIRGEHDFGKDPELALRHVGALMNASARYETGAECLEMAGRIAAIRGEHDFGKDRELALEHVQALYNASVSYETGAECLEMAGRIAAIRGEHDFGKDREMALEHVQALYNASARYETGAECLKMAGRIAAIRGEHDFGKDREMALEHAKALYNASARYETGAERLEMAGRIAAIRGEHDFGKDREMALEHAQALANASVRYVSNSEAKSRIDSAQSALSICKAHADDKRFDVVRNFIEKYFGSGGQFENDGLEF